MERGEYRPNGEQFAEGSGQEQSGVNPFHALIERQRLNLPDINEYCFMWSDLRRETSRERVPEEVHQMVIHVSNGLDFVLFEHLNLTQQASILGELQRHREVEGIEQFELTYEEGRILRDAAAAVNVAYDPGTPEEIEKRTFSFSDLEAKASPEALELRDWYASHNI
jgi:hypothetical protein